MPRRKRSENGDESVESNVPDGNPENCPLDAHYWRTVNGITLCPACGIHKKDLPDAVA